MRALRARGCSKVPGGQHPSKAPCEAQPLAACPRGARAGRGTICQEIWQAAKRLWTAQCLGAESEGPPQATCITSKQRAESTRPCRGNHRWRSGEKMVIEQSKPTPWRQTSLPV